MTLACSHPHASMLRRGRFKQQTFSSSRTRTYTTGCYDNRYTWPRKFALPAAKHPACSTYRGTPHNPRSCPCASDDCRMKKRPVLLDHSSKMGNHTLTNIILSPVRKRRSRRFVATFVDSLSRRQIPEPAVHQTVVVRIGKARLITYVDGDLTKEFDGCTPKHGLVIDLQEFHRYSHQGHSSRSIADIVSQRRRPFQGGTQLRLDRYFTLGQDHVGSRPADSLIRLQDSIPNQDPKLIQMAVIGIGVGAVDGR